MGAVFAQGAIHDAFMDGAGTASSCSTATPIPAIRWPAPPALATLEVFKEQELLERAAGDRSRTGRTRCTRCKGLPHVIDIRNHRPDRRHRAGAASPASRARAPSTPSSRRFADGVLIRMTGDIIALSPPLMLEKKHIDELFGKLATVLKNLD